MTRIYLALAVTTLAVGPVAGQSATVKNETKIEVKDGKDVTLTGCVARHPDETGATAYQLTDVADKFSERHSYLLVGDTGDLEDHVGHLVEIKGKAADREHGKVKIQSKTKVDRDDAPDRKTESTSEMKGDLVTLPLLGVKEVKMLRPTCS
jgi:hypothetical protein